ncbi:hypothetical protein PUNSTDRAFT_43248 [Punctularia strigosozonata HHB-11173 SS5]|uniref:uncharacterized protein n=1 Tax=Punctularia strigosozonata (strain HHB-11173) TaxID=741275 RepID=UPI0004416B2E|nr:uncharacterized protein PUNSTDRAFT_43248 [Punctularia strigosozonata HHB-11173 SS5]EIN10279.1 hypothetical protein PUNSTDRAFT_43248 [Punctularia strigosozonata HHB-11173 SS5]
MTTITTTTRTETTLGRRGPSRPGTAQSAVSVYPVPPPTSNTLTGAQRARLVRSANKIGRVLGSTPRLVDFDESTVSQGHRRHATTTSSRRYPRTPVPGAAGARFNTVIDVGGGSSRAHSRTGSASSTASSSSAWSASAASASSRTAETSVSSSSLFSVSPAEEELMSEFGELTTDATTTETWRTRHASPTERRPPLLRLALGLRARAPVGSRSGRAAAAAVRPGLATVPASPLFAMDGEPEEGEGEEGVGAVEAPTFRIRTEASERRAKMERVRRLLGECVPVELVFPTREEGDDDGPDSPSTDSSSEKVEVRVTRNGDARCVRRRGGGAEKWTLEAIEECAGEDDRRRGRP